MGLYVVIAKEKEKESKGILTLPIISILNCMAFFVFTLLENTQSDKRTCLEFHIVMFREYFNVIFLHAPNTFTNRFSRL